MASRYLGDASRVEEELMYVVKNSLRDAIISVMTIFVPQITFGPTFSREFSSIKLGEPEFLKIIRCELL